MLYATHLITKVNNYRDLEGRLVACSSGLRAIIRREYDGEWKLLVDRYQSKRLNSPNDLVVKGEPPSWEKAFMYCVMLIAIAVLGPGAYLFDALIFGR
ncbi:hypothetical protein [Nostoc sp. LPT]|uniref:DoxX family protein n=1 Tax=Nostoc sp. LPT TaxID=2815387 RepID=UPI0025DEE890|nr:hypothetical protein [Nostoc sp. LPT]